MKYIINGDIYSHEYLYVHIEKRIVPIESKKYLTNNSFIIVLNSYFLNYNELSKENIILYS